MPQFAPIIRQTAGQGRIANSKFEAWLFVISRTRTFSYVLYSVHLQFGLAAFAEAGYGTYMNVVNEYKENDEDSCRRRAGWIGSIWCYRGRGKVPVGSMQEARAKTTYNDTIESSDWVSHSLTYQSLNLYAHFPNVFWNSNCCANSTYYRTISLWLY